MLVLLGLYIRRLHHFLYAFQIFLHFFQICLQKFPNFSSFFRFYLLLNFLSGINIFSYFLHTPPRLDTCKMAEKAPEPMTRDEQIASAKELYARGYRNYVVGDFYAAVDDLSRSCELYAQVSVHVRPFHPIYPHLA